MNKNSLIRKIVNENNELFILYLDDSPSDLANFEAQVNIFNISEDNEFKDTLKLRVTTTEDNREVEGLLKDQDTYKIFLCDHNMPKKKGLEFIKYLQPEYPHVVYVLYSAAANINQAVREECTKNKILVFSKTEEVSTLIEKLIFEINKQPSILNRIPKNKSKMDDLYEFIAKDIIDDMNSIRSPDHVIRVSGKTYTPNDIVEELTNKTDFAFQYVKNYLRGLKFLNKKSL